MSKMSNLHAHLNELGDGFDDCDAGSPDPKPPGKTVKYVRKCFDCGHKMTQPCTAASRCWCGSQTFITHQEDTDAEFAPPPDPKPQPGRAPWRYECHGDSDGEQVGYDHFVFDADGNEIATAPNEAVGKLIAAAPSLLDLADRLAWLATFVDDEMGTSKTQFEELRKQLAAPQVFWRAPSPDAVYTLEADLKRALEDRAKLIRFVQSLAGHEFAGYEDIGHVQANAQCVLAEVEGGAG